MTAPRGLHAELMHPPGERRKFDVSHATKKLQHTVFECREFRAFFAFLCALGARFLRELANPVVPHARVRRNGSFDERPVHFANAVLGELRMNALRGLRVAREADNATYGPVEPVWDAQI